MISTVILHIITIDYLMPSVRVFADVSQLAEEASPNLVNVRVRFSPSAFVS